MNHKRKKPKNARAGCLLCKPHKANGAKDKEAPRVKRKLQDPPYPYANLLEQAIEEEEHSEGPSSWPDTDPEDSVW